MSLRGSKKTSKMEPKVISGRGFFHFGQSLISCNTTRVLLDFHGFRLPRGGQKTIKKRFRKKNVKKAGPKPIFCKTLRKWSPKWTPIWTTNSPPIPPRWGHYSDLGPKGAQKEPKGAKRLPKDPKTAQKEAKRVPKRCQKEAKEV